MDEPMEDRQTKPLSEFWGWDLGLLGGIGTSRLRFGLQGGVLGLKARIWAFRLEFGPQDCNLGHEPGIWGGGTKEKKKEKKEKIPNMCEPLG